ncbi:hypothetical protein G3N95_17165 [Paraburkholderia sp. Tr-20389]|uniref:hypothetical protein n=1 Tax=Paraburkholderia sp. Tr-20389 TaxID=2703903 RepID=UPI0019803540|nr:hypothetical protein [Paraburkholderia sp. Tr-20389]MBN3754684.1 hypothetical protein [Paraburkholderia sp. Tr-20389]
MQKSRLCGASLLPSFRLLFSLPVRLFRLSGQGGARLCEHILEQSENRHLSAQFETGELFRDFLETQ